MDGVMKIRCLLGFTHWIENRKITIDFKRDAINIIITI
jgi:hypothetical protein